MYVNSSDSSADGKSCSDKGSDDGITAVVVAVTRMMIMKLTVHADATLKPNCCANGDSYIGYMEKITAVDDGHMHFYLVLALVLATANPSG
jgi:hypothetical protein